jgi:hypothetical protein
LCCCCAAPTALHRKMRADWAEVSRGRSTGLGIAVVAGKDRTSSETEELVLLVPVAVIAAIPRTRASCREQTVSSVEHRS